MFLKDLKQFGWNCLRNRYVRSKMQKMPDMSSEETRAARVKLRTEFAIPTQWAFSVKLCPTLFSQGMLQLHVAVVFRWAQLKKVRSADTFILIGRLPQHVKAQARKAEMKKEGRYLRAAVLLRANTEGGYGASRQ